jgi:hypothetical protein
MHIYVLCCLLSLLEYQEILLLKDSSCEKYDDMTSKSCTKVFASYFHMSRHSFLQMQQLRLQENPHQG